MQDDVSCFVWGALESNRKHGEVTEDNIKIFVINEDICMGSEFFESPRTLRITFLRSPDADSLISYAFKGVMI